MSQCDFCEKKAKVTFICPECGKRFCGEHRKPEDHNCPGLETEQDNSQNENLDSNEVEPVDPEQIIPYAFLNEFEGINPHSNEDLYSDSIEELVLKESDDTGPSIETVENPEEIMMDEDSEDGLSLQKNDELVDDGSEFEQKPSMGENVSRLNFRLILIPIIIVSVLVGALMGVLVMPGNNESNLEERYDALYDYYLELQAKNQNLTQEIDQQSILLSSIENDLNQSEQELAELKQDWETLFSDNIEYTTPSISELERWLSQDNTDEKTVDSTYSDIQQAVELSMKAKLQNWKLGVLTIHGEWEGSIIEHTYCYTVTESGIVVYITSQTDSVWWSDNYDIVSSGETWDIDGYNDVIVSRVDFVITL